MIWGCIWSLERVSHLIVARHSQKPTVVLRGVRTSLSSKSRWRTGTHWQNLPWVSATLEEFSANPKTSSEVEVWDVDSMSQAQLCIGSYLQCQASFSVLHVGGYRQPALTTHWGGAAVPCCTDRRPTCFESGAGQWLDCLLVGQPCICSPVQWGPALCLTKS